LTLVDTNVIVDILANNPGWMPWSAERLTERSGFGALIINDVIYAEIGIGFETEATLVEKLEPFGLVRERIPSSALFLAGKAYLRYREGGGSRTGVLPDFFIGAHAQVARLPILTRDTRRYRNYFPGVELISPE
jgi:predicted nucleic acid-binding protein